MALHTNEWYTNGLLRQQPEVVNGIFKECLPQVMALVKSNSGTTEDAKDVFMYAIEVIYRKIKNNELVLTAAFTTYLYEVCRRRWLNELRDNKDSGVTTDHPAVLTLASTEPTSDQTVWSERKKLFSEKLQQIAQDCQMVLSLAWNTEMSMEEIAEAMGWTYAYARKRKHDCKTFLIKAVQSDPRYHELKN